MHTTIAQTLRLHAEGRLDTLSAERILNDMLTDLERRRLEITEQQCITASALIALEVRKVRETIAATRPRPTS